MSENTETPQMTADEVSAKVNQDQLIGEKLLDEAVEIYYNLNSERFTEGAVVNYERDILGYPAVYIVEKTQQGRLLLKALMPRGFRLEMMDGQMAVFLESFPRPFYSYQMHLVDGKPKMMMTSRWIEQRFSNPDHPPGYLGDALDTVARAVHYILALQHPDLNGARFIDELMGDFTGKISTEISSGVSPLMSVRTGPKFLETYGHLIVQILGVQGMITPEDFRDVSKVRHLWDSWVVGFQTALRADGHLA